MTRPVYSGECRRREGGDPVTTDRAISLSDPALAHYRAFDLATTGTAALFHIQLWARGAVCALAYGFGRQPAEAIRQLPGVFVVHGTRILAEFRHTSPSDRPDYLDLIRRAASVTIR